MPKPAPLTMPKGKAAPVAAHSSAAPSPSAKTATADLTPLSFKVPKSFDKAFRQAALDADLKLNELLFKAFSVYLESKKS